MRTNNEILENADMPGKERIIPTFWLKGFTLLETLFVILLTSIVLSLTFLYFNTFQKYITSITRTSGYEADILRFESLLVYDIDRAFAVRLKSTYSSDIECSGINVGYEINEGHIIRTQNNVSDTVWCESVELIPYFHHPSREKLKGFELEVTDFRNRTRIYGFYKNSTEKDEFEKHWKQNN